MQETEYHRLAEKTLLSLSEALESADEEGILDTESNDSTLTIKLPSGKQLLISKHAVTRQLWLASPLSGGLHFTFDTAKTAWNLADGRTLQEVLAQELQVLADIKLQLEDTH